tara:strand:- start:301 stop:465 length:165 start_codon:yes stop_codon:yes gene_type:complete
MLSKNGREIVVTNLDEPWTISNDNALILTLGQAHELGLILTNDPWTEKFEAEDG